MYKRTKSMAQILEKRDDCYLLEAWNFLHPIISTTISDGFGVYDWRSSPHFGVDLGTIKDYRHPVFAVGGGRVIYAGLNGDYGNCVIIRHGNNGGFVLDSLYAHLFTITRKAGDTIKKGDIIGQVGGRPGERGAGRSTSPHLHFEFIIRKPKLHNFLGAKWVTLGPAVAVDPAPFFPAMAGKSQWR